MDDIVLLLTACINPNGMSYTVVQDIGNHSIFRLDISC